MREGSNKSLKNVVEISEVQIQTHLDKMVLGTVEAMLDAEAPAPFPQPFDTNYNVDYDSYKYPHSQGVRMKTVQMTLDEDLVKSIDRLSKRLHTSRSAFTRMALREALARHDLKQLERKHRQGYERHPVSSGEFSVWESEQAWGDE